MGSDDGAPGLTGMGRRHGDRAGQQASAGTAAIEVSYLTKDFGGRTAIAYVSFSVTCGEVFGFLWPQQCRENYDRADARHAAVVLIVIKKSNQCCRHEPIAYKLGAKGKLPDTVGS